jgi:hypothetical protein
VGWAIPLVALLGQVCSLEAHSPDLSVFKEFVWLEVDSDKMALSRPAHLPVTQAIRPLWSATLTPQLSGMEFGRVEYGDRVANTIVKGSVYGTF